MSRVPLVRQTSASFADGAPSRPERRRPLNSSPSPTPTALPEGRFPERPMSTLRTQAVELDSDEGHEENEGDSVAFAGDKSRRMMQRLNLSAALSSSTRLDAPVQRRRRDSSSSLSSTSSDSSLPPSSIPPAAPFVPTPALALAASAFSRAGERRRAPDERPGPPKRKETSKSVALNALDYPDTPAFREIEAVMRQIKGDWPILLQGTTEEVLADGQGDTLGEYDPVALGLSLLSPSTVGTPNSLPAFLRLKADLDHAISSSLASSNSSYRAYETSITTYNATLANLGASVKTIGGLKKGLGAARVKLEGNGKEGLVGMYNRMNHLEEMCKILDEIDHLRTVPDRIESLLSEKRFLSAVILLVRSTKMANKPDMIEIGALNDLRTWMTSQEGVLLEILIEELHNHLYLKSFYCDGRWKAYTRGQKSLPHVDFGLDYDPHVPPPLLETTTKSSGRSNARKPQATKLQRYLNDLTLRPSTSPLLDEPIDDVAGDAARQEDLFAMPHGAGASFSAASGDNVGPATDTKESRGNPERDSFVFVEQLMESLGILGKLGWGLDAVSQRVQTEMFSLVEGTLEEVEERNDLTRQGSLNARLAATASSNSTSFLFSSSSPSPIAPPVLSTLSLSHTSLNPSSLLRLTSAETTELESNVETLQDLFWTLFSKLDAVLQGFRVAYEVSLRIAERRDFKDASITRTSSGSLMFSLVEVWKPVQQEVRALLHDYLTDDQSGTVSSRNPIASVNEVLRAAKSGRDLSKQIFKFSDSDLKPSTRLLKSHEDQLQLALRNTVPGLMTEGSTLAGAGVGGAYGADGSYGPGTSAFSGRGAGSAGGATHKTLVPSDSFNVSVLFSPTLAFLERASEIMPSGLMGGYDAGSAGFLDEFVLRTFLPQLEEKVSRVFFLAVGGKDAFQEDPNWKRISQVPIVKSVSNLMLLISSLCSMLRSTPFHRDNYSHLIVSVIHQFYQRCAERFKDLTARDLGEYEARQQYQPGSSLLREAANWAEAAEVNECLAEIRGIAPKDVERMREALKRETKIELERKGNSQISAADLLGPSKKLLALGTLYSSLNWFIVHVSSLTTSATTDGLQDLAEDEPTEFSLPLTEEMTKPFDALLKSYQQLADLVLYSLRVEVRLRTMHFLDKATRDGVYQLSEDIAEPDSSVVDLNSALAECDECAATTLAGPERRFIFEGLSLLMDHLLISNSRYIRLANEHGLAKMNRNILALQQNLKNIGDEPLEVNFDRSRTFWEVFGRGPSAMIESIRKKQISFDFEDYKSLLNLQCGIDQSSKDDPSDGPASATGDKSRLLYNNYLIELFTLDVET